MTKRLRVERPPGSGQPRIERLDSDVSWARPGDGLDRAEIAPQDHRDGAVVDPEGGTEDLPTDAEAARGGWR